MSKKKQKKFFIKKFLKFECLKFRFLKFDNLLLTSKIPVGYSANIAIGIMAIDGYINEHMM